MINQSLTSASMSLPFHKNNYDNEMLIAANNSKPSQDILALCSPNDGYCINGKKMTAPHGAFVVLAHGSATRGIADDRLEGAQSRKFLSPIELVDLIKLGMNGRNYNKVIFAACLVGMNDMDLQLIADNLDMPVYAPTRNFVVNKHGLVSIRSGRLADGSLSSCENSETVKIEYGYLKEVLPKEKQKRFGFCERQNLVECLPK
jgi:hypothetical protein